MPEGIQFNNATQKPCMYYARHFFPGVAEYKNERIQVDLAAMKKMCKSMEACPVYVLHQDVDIENIHNADGFVSDNFINPHDGWMWSKFVAVSDAAHEAVAKGWKVSNAYVPLEFGGAGTQHNVDYNRKILNAKFTHLAIVPNPRYEEAQIFTPEEYKKYNEALKQSELVNSKNTTGKPTMRFYKMIRQAITGDAIDDETMVELEGGKTMTIAEMKNSLEVDAKAKKEADDAAAAEAAKKPAAATSDELKNAKITVAGVEMTVAEAAEKLNALETEKKEKDAAAALEVKNATLKEAEKAGATNFDELANAAEKAKAGKSGGQIIETNADMIRRGKELC